MDEFIFLGLILFIGWVILMILLYPYGHGFHIKLMFWLVNLACPGFGILIWWYIIKH